MAYDRVITACDRAKAAAADRPSNWRQTFHDETVRAQAILVELVSVLQVEHRDPEVAALSKQLAGLYRFTLDQLVRANMSKDHKQLSAPRATIDGLREAWIAGVLLR